MMNTTNVAGGKPIAVLLQPISGVCTINPLVAFYDRENIFIALSQLQVISDAIPVSNIILVM
jgi:hypothetical protein